MDISITSININLASTSGTSSVGGDGQKPRPFRAAMDAAASALGLQPKDLFAALQSGQSLADIAKSKGVSQDQLVSAMSTAITKANPSISADQANQIAQRLATQVPGQDGTGQSAAATSGTSGTHHGHHHHQGGGGDLLSAASNALGQSTSSLLTALQSGQRLASIGSANGVSQDQLVGAIVTALQRDNPNLSTDQATQFATEFATASGQSGSQVNLSA